MDKLNMQESEQVEFKESLSDLDELGQAIAAFTNKLGGTIYVGVKNNGELLGLGNINEKTMRDTSQFIYDNLEPRKIFSINKEIVGGKNLFRITVEKSPTPYHTFKDKPYLRIGNTTKIMPQDEYQRRLIRFKSIEFDYSSTTLQELKMEDLSDDAVNELRRLLIQSGRYQVRIEELNDEQLLKDLLLIRDGKLTIASLILLGTEASLGKYLPFCEIRYGYRLKEDGISNQDTAIFKMGYLAYYNNVWEKIQSRNLTVTIPFKMRLIEKKAFDEQTIREALNNAVVHRDYQVNESSFIFQFPTKIVIKNPGGFPEGITIANILTETKPRNKLLADILFKCELVEQFGNGVNLMFKNQLSLGKNPPDYKQTSKDRVILQLDGSIQDLEFAKYVIRVAESKNKLLNDEELLTLHKIKNNQIVKSNEITQRLLNLGLIERIGYSKYMLSKQYYADIGKKGKYTKKRGLTRDKNKELIIQHLVNFGSGKKRDFLELFDYELTEKQIWGLLEELKKEGKIHFGGKRRSPKGEWKLVRSSQGVD